MNIKGGELGISIGVRPNVMYFFGSRLPVRRLSIDLSLILLVELELNVPDVSVLIYL